MELYFNVYHSEQNYRRWLTAYMNKLSLHAHFLICSID